MKKIEKDRLEEIYYCFRYSFSCKSCPKSRECEEKAKKEETWKKKVKEKDSKESGE